MGGREVHSVLTWLRTEKRHGSSSINLGLKRGERVREWRKEKGVKPERLRTTETLLGGAIAGGHL